MAHDPSSPPKFLVPETWAVNLGRVPWALRGFVQPRVEKRTHNIYLQAVNYHSGPTIVVCVPFYLHIEIQCCYVYVHCIDVIADTKGTLTTIVGPLLC